MSIHSLSPELIWRIASFIDEKPDLKNFRLSSRSFVHPTRGELFQYLYVRPSLDSLTHLRTFCHSQRHLVGIVGRVVMLLGNWEILIWQPFLTELQSYGIQLNANQQPQASILLANVLTKYSKFLQDPLFTKILLFCFQCLRSLRAIVIEREAIHDDCHDDIGHAHDKINRTCDEGGFALWRRIYDYGLYLEDLGHSIVVEWPYADGYRSFKALSEAAYYSGREIHSWNVESMVGIESVILSNEEVLRRAAAVFSKCRTLRLDLFLGDITATKVVEETANGELSVALQSARHLRKLEIGCDNDMKISFELLLGMDYSWRNLQEIRITSINFYAEHFQKFLQRHRATLQLVWIRQCQLSLGSWLGPEGLKHWIKEVYLPSSRMEVFQLRWLFETDGIYAGNIIYGDIKNHPKLQN